MNKPSQPAKYSPSLILLIIVVALVAAVSLQNWQLVRISIIQGFCTWEIPFALTIFFSLFVGMGFGLVWSMAQNKSKINADKLEQWKAQDTKMLAGLTSDKERLLEAKIATLEAALKTALKKS